jgi:hypothetical protein
MGKPRQDGLGGTAVSGQFAVESLVLKNALLLSSVEPPPIRIGRKRSHLVVVRRPKGGNRPVQYCAQELGQPVGNRLYRVWCIQ